MPTESGVCKICGGAHSDGACVPENSQIDSRSVRITELIPNINTKDFSTVEEIINDPVLEKACCDKQEKIFQESGGHASAEPYGHNVAGVVLSPEPKEGERSSSLLIYDKNHNERLRIWNETQEAIKLLKEQIIVDLGAGGNSSGCMIAKKAAAKAYVAVEPVHYRALAQNLQRINSIPYAIAPEDMLTFLRRLPDHSVAVYASGQGLGYTKKYIYLVNEEIKRVVTRESAYLGGGNNDFMEPRFDEDGIFTVRTGKEIAMRPQRLSTETLTALAYRVEGMRVENFRMLLVDEFPQASCVIIHHLEKAIIGRRREGYVPVLDYADWGLKNIPDHISSESYWDNYTIEQINKESTLPRNKGKNFYKAIFYSLFHALYFYRSRVGEGKKL